VNTFARGKQGGQGWDKDVQGEDAVSSQPESLTLSENLFEQFINQHGLIAERIPTAPHQTPDYLLKLKTSKIAVEITTVHAVADGDAISGYTRTMGNAVRREITDKSKQLRWAEKNEFSSLLLLHESRAGYPWFLEDHDFQTAMYGEFTLKIGRKTRNFGPIYQHKNAKMRLDNHTHLSALGRIFFDHNGALTITIFPNLFAATPIPRDQWPQCFDLKEFELEYINPAPIPAK
jgi:hypothetical protein